MKHLHRRGPGTDIAAGFPCFLVGEKGPLLLELLWGPCHRSTFSLNVGLQLELYSTLLKVSHVI